MSFNALGLSAPLLAALSKQGYTAPTPIQAQAIPVVLAGRDVLAAAQTGTGKTAGFTLPMLELLSKNKPQDAKAVRALVLAPTRELVAQVQESVQTYGAGMPFKSAAIFGGVGIFPQIAALRKGAQIVVATPGRLLDHVGQRTIDLSKVEFLVLDEADRMLDMGFIHDIKKILALLPKNRQNLLFSATFAPEIKKLADGFLTNPATIEVARQNCAAETVKQTVHPVDRERKRDLLAKIIDENNWKQVLVFTRTKHGANKLAEFLDREGISADAIHGNKSQSARTKALADFKKGVVRVLVATDIAARGIDIDDLPHVVNYELPNVAEDYVHRIGRTGRAGREGEAISLVCVDERDLLRGIERLLDRSIEKVTIDGFAPDPSIRPEPIQNGRNRGSQSQSRGGYSSDRGNSRGFDRAPREGDRHPSGNSFGGNRDRDRAPRADDRRGASAARPARDDSRRSDRPDRGDFREGRPQRDASRSRQNRY